MRRCPATGKIMYESADYAKRRTRNVSNRLRVYRCEHCRAMHVTDHEHCGRREE